MTNKTQPNELRGFADSILLKVFDGGNGYVDLDDGVIDVRVRLTANEIAYLQWIGCDLSNSEQQEVQRLRRAIREIAAYELPRAVRMIVESVT